MNFFEKWFVIIPLSVFAGLAVAAVAIFCAQFVFEHGWGGLAFLISTMWVTVVILYAASKP